jgi:hypothetical protein
MLSMPLHLAPGKSTSRKALHRRYGGRERGGISPSRKSPFVFLFTDPERGQRHGYIYDGQRKDGLYDYTGEGQDGEQQMIQGNRAIRDHRAEGRELHLFKANGKKVTYIGRYEYADHYPGIAGQTRKAGSRAVIVFRLRPIGKTAPVDTSPLEKLIRRQVKAVPVEQQLTEETTVQPNPKPYQATRREQKLVLRYEEILKAQGHEVCRLQLWPTGEPAPFYSDLYDRTMNTLVEAKGSVARSSFRMAIGQLADYARLVKPSPKKAILVPERPRPDLVKLAKSEGIGVIWPKSSGGFTASWPASP